MPELPALGEAPKKSPLPGIAITAIAIGLIAGGVYRFTHRSTEDTPPPTPPPADGAPVAAAVPNAPGDAPAAVPPAPGTPTPPVAAPAAPLVVPVGNPQWKSFSAVIHGPLESAIIGATNKEVGAPLTQVVNRTLVWWVAVPGDLLKGDTISAVYEERTNQEPLVHAVRFTSKKMGKTFEAYRYKPTGSELARFYQPDGTELEERLVDAPLDTYEQITSLLRDGRRHKGVDFKTPMGTPVHATFDGVVQRKNWSFRSNGNCLEIRETGGKGRTAMFLHLSEIEKGVEPGAKVKRGDAIAKSGNTGHSFAPHLHYQLMQGETVIDPFKSHDTKRESISAEQKGALDAEISKLKTALGPEPTPGG